MNTLISKRQYNRITIWTAIFLLLFAFIQIIAQYHFFYMEQWQTFYYESSFIKNVLLQPGGLAFLSADFLVQFFCLPYCGALLLSLLLLVTAYYLSRIIDYIIPHSHLTYLSLLPILSLLFLQITNNKYNMAGSVAFMFMVVALYYYTIKKSLKVRIFYSVITSIVLFVTVGPVATLFAVCVLLHGLIADIRHSYYYILSILFVFIMASISVCLGFAGDYKNLFLLDYYFYQSDDAPSFAYQSWILMALLYMTCLLLRKVDHLQLTRTKIFQTLQILLIIVFGYFNYKSVYVPKEETFMRFTYYLRMRQWDNIKKLSENMDMSNYLFQVCHNIALAEKGELAEHLLDYPQEGLASIYLSDNITSPDVAMLVSDEYFSMGCIAMSQHWAFEANESMGDVSPYCFQRLAQTNLIFGAYKVADKYLSILDNTLFYNSWADSQRKFLYHDKAIEQDPFLDSKRKCIFPENCFGGQYGIDYDLQRIIDHNPDYKPAIQYLGSMYILINDMDKFDALIRRYYKTKALPTLPKSFRLIVDKYHINLKDSIH